MRLRYLRSNKEAEWKSVSMIFISLWRGGMVGLVVEPKQRQDSLMERDIMK